MQEIEIASELSWAFILGMRGESVLMLDSTFCKTYICCAIDTSMTSAQFCVQLDDS